MVDIAIGKWMTIWGVVTVYLQDNSHVWFSISINGTVRKYKAPKEKFIDGTRVQIYQVPKEFEEIP